MREAKEIKTEEKACREPGKGRGGRETDPPSAFKSCCHKGAGAQAEGDQLHQGNHLLTGAPSRRWCDLTWVNPLFGTFLICPKLVRNTRPLQLQGCVRIRQVVTTHTPRDLGAQALLLQTEDACLLPSAQPWNYQRLVFPGNPLWTLVPLACFLRSPVAWAHGHSFRRPAPPVPVASRNHTQLAQPGQHRPPHITWPSVCSSLKCAPHSTLPF